jgi:hypothetical protein
MDPRQKLAFDEKNPPEITEGETDPVLLYVESDGHWYCAFAGEPSAFRSCTDRNGISRNATYGSPSRAREVALQLADGTLVMPIKTEAVQDDTEKKRFVYSFPRLIDGKPALAANDTGRTFIFGRILEGGGRVRPLQNAKKFRVADTSGAIPKRISFPTAGLMYNGKLAY